VQGLKERCGLDINLNIPDQFGRLLGDLELVIFRIVQESMTNMHRHSGSKTAAITVRRDAGSIVVEVQDEGRGISSERRAEIHALGTGVGISGMRERLRHFRGELRIESNGTGTKMIATLPV
jgi:two-component system, NarL family, sensor kinase